MKRTWRFLAFIAIGGLLVLGCEDDANPLAPYEGERPLILQRVTVSARPQIQWVGGRAAAVGVNQGDQAALDTTLVWLMTAGGNDISSAITVGPNADEEQIRTYGGTPVDQLENGQEYTFWIADLSAMDAGLPVEQLDDFSFIDTTLTLNYLLQGRSGGDDSFIDEIQIVRDQQLTSDTYIVTWTPSDVGVQRLAIRQGSSGGFTDLIWDIIADNEQGILPPVVIGEPPEGVQVAVAWSDEGFSPATYTLWMTSDTWAGSFVPNASGYAFFQIFSTNFD